MLESGLSVRHIWSLGAKNQGFDSYIPEACYLAGNAGSRDLEANLTHEHKGLKNMQTESEFSNENNSGMGITRQERVQ